MSRPGTTLRRRRWLAWAGGTALGLPAAGVPIAAAAAQPSAQARNGGQAAAAADPRPPRPRTLQVFGTRIRYHEFGQPGTQPTLVLLHGLGSSAWGDWGRVMPALARTHHVLAPDQLGFGASDKPAIAYGIQTWVDFLGEFLRLKRVGAFTLMGESLGGWIAARYTLQALKGEALSPSFALPPPSRLVLCDAAGFRRTQDAMSGKPAAGTPVVSLAAQKALLGLVFHDPAYGSDEGVRRGMAWSLAKGDSATIAAVTGNPALAEESIDGQLGGITIPTLVVWGEHDLLVPLELGRRYAAEIPGARLVVIPGTGHAPMIETPQAFLQAVADFMRP